MPGFLTVIIICFTLLSVLIIVLHRKQVIKIDTVLPVVASILGVWAFCTSWFWFYYFNVFISLPAFVIAFVLNTFSQHKGYNQRLIRVNWLLMTATLCLAILSYLYFDI
jgi:presenilin-like A22 family membrane protease